MQKLTTYKQKNTNTHESDIKWYLIDATNVRLGQISTKVAELLLAKDQVDKVDYQLSNRGVIIINSDLVSYFPKRERNKMYYSHSGYPGGFSEISLGDLMKKDSRKVIEHAVSGMLPKNKLRQQYMTRVRIYKNDQHGHSAQQPEVIKLS